ncbi:hypothetical protein C8J57DRAFT_1291747 [Mycena rebaudengoi]|nr:hypothetical protein C8J57DRAFT_1291747 [Mycena rebaudengoi]
MDSRTKELHQQLLLAQATRDIEKLRNILECIEREVKGTFKLQETDFFWDIHMQAITFPDDEALASLANRVYENLVDNCLPALIEDTDSRWWKRPPPPTENRVILVFKDVTQIHLSALAEDWGLIEVESSLDEPFTEAFMRFRVVGNQKYRHPFCPTLEYDAVLPSGILSISSEDAVQVRRVVDQVGLLVPYIRKDEDTLQLRCDHPVARLKPWDRTLPAWFSATQPSHWIEPAPPPSYAVSLSIPWTSFSDPIVYFKVPLLHFPGNGRNTLPSVLDPPIITSHIYVPASRGISGFSTEVFTARSDLGLPVDVFIPPLSTAQVKTFLGRVIRYSRYPLASKGKKKTGSYEYAFAWGWNPTTLELHCFNAGLGAFHSGFILDLKMPATIIVNTAFMTSDPFALNRTCCQWLGAIIMPEDRWALKSAANDFPSASEHQVPPDPLPKPSYLSGELIDVIKRLNVSPRARIFEVPEGSSLLIGDVQLAKVELDFEVVLDNVQPGVWASHGTRPVLMYWVQNGTVNYENLTHLAVRDPFFTAWTFSVDAGVSCAIVSEALNDGGPLVSLNTDPETVLEELMDMYEGSLAGARGSPVGDDGNYTVSLHRNAEGCICAVKYDYTMNSGH